MSPVPIQPRKRLPRPGMTENQRRAFIKLRELEEKVKWLLRNEDVPTVDYIWYHTFARQCARALREADLLAGPGEKLRELTERWTERRLKQPILLRILKDIFFLDLPAETEGTTDGHG